MDYTENTNIELPSAVKTISSEEVNKILKAGEKFGRKEVGTPQVQESFDKGGWIKFGNKNDFPQELLRLYQNSSGLHSRLIDKKVDMTTGLGFKEIIDLKALEFINNEYGDTDLNEIADECDFDLWMFGGYYLNIVWDADEANSIAKIYRIPYEKVRCQNPDQFGCVNGYYISRDWIKHTKPENKPEYYVAFDESNHPAALERRKACPSQILFVRVNKGGMEYYTLPSYQTEVNNIKLAYEISTYQLKSAQNSYMPSLIVTIPSVPPPAERERIQDDIKARSGTDNAGETVVLFGQDKEKLPIFTILQPSTNDQKFKDSVDVMRESIYIVHQANNVIAGIAVGGKLANTSEVKEQYALFQATVIAKAQKNLERTFNKLARINGVTTKLEFNNYLDYLNENLNPSTTNEAPTQS